METKPFTLRSHEKSADGFNIEATYTVLQDGKPLGFTEHFDVLRRANAYPKLVEELRVLAGKYETLQARLDEKSGYTAQFQCSAVLEALALLRELGEVK